MLAVVVDIGIVTAADVGKRSLHLLHLLISEEQLGLVLDEVVLTVDKVQPGVVVVRRAAERALRLRQPLLLLVGDVEGAGERCRGTCNI